ncbi:MAG: glutamine--fructose-6-phosphate transaminase (isomerizing) [Candidatus Kerfeldbacteria bacterium]|nr:glutamine--fructose-6-phosphate transaminase (isomerizing) [Candidatus Kerfeldbacteria bacterium]
MCGIIGYIGKQEAKPILLEGLKRMEYRGYDSAGLAIMDTQNSKVHLYKKAGKLGNLKELLDTHLVQGTVGVAHCLVPDTLIQLANGRVMKIADMPEKADVLSLDTTTNQFIKKKARLFKHPAPEQLFQIRTSVSRFTSTENHRMLIVRDGHIEEKYARDIQPGDILCAPKKISLRGQKISFICQEPQRYWQLTSKTIEVVRNTMAQQEINVRGLANVSGISSSFIYHFLRQERHAQEYSTRRFLKTLSLPFPLEGMTPVNSIHGNFVQLPRRSSSELMQILGYFIGDGHAHERCVRFKDTRKAVLEQYRELIKTVFGITGRIVPLKGVAAFLLEVNSTEVVAWLKTNILERRRAFYDEIGQLPDRELRKFLRGIFDAEGTIRVRAGQVSLAMIDGDFVGRIQQWLLRFGMMSSVCIQKKNIQQKRPHATYIVSMSGADSITRFHKEIGFTAPEKQKKLQRVLEQKSAMNVTNSYAMLPWDKTEIATQLKKIGIRGAAYRQLHGKGSPSRGTIEQFFQLLSVQQSAHPYIQQLQQLFTGELVFQKVTEVQTVRSTFPYVYDLEVSGTENFIANGLVSHNSRWATHGEPNDTNAHPHSDCGDEIFIIHNGIIENFSKLKQRLIQEKHTFKTATDTEVLAHLIEAYYKKCSLEQAVSRALKEVVGTYGLAVFSSREPNKIVAARLGSPLILGIVNVGEYIVASDLSAILPHTREVVYLEEAEMVTVTRDGYTITTLDQQHIEHPVSRVEWTAAQAEKNGHEHFMLKEMLEQPEVILNGLRGRLIEEDGIAHLGGFNENIKRWKNIERIIIVACGTASYASKVGEYMLEEYAEIPVEVEFGSEFRYRKPVLDEKTAVVLVSQSGETADTIASLREAKRRGVFTFGLVNVIGSTIAREVDAGMYIHSGPEKAVASTKVFTGMLNMFALLTLALGRQRNMSLVTGQRIAKELMGIPEKMQTIFQQSDNIAEMAKKYSSYDHALFLGRKYNYPVAVEGAHKLKEISYVHAEGYPAGEPKHGALALIDDRFYSIFIAPEDSVYQKNISNIQEFKARHGRVLVITTEGNTEMQALADDVIYIPKTLEMLTPMLSIIPLQLFAYHVAVLRGHDVDQPRNLAKSVTVE